MRKISKEELNIILEKHKIYITTSGKEGERADLKEAYLSGVDLSGADLRGADLSGADLSRADLKEAYLSGAYLSRADLSRADLREAYLSRADLSRADLSRADLREAYLRRADLREANLSGVDLRGADLEEAYLEGADLRGAYLDGANLEGAYLKGADLEGADLEGVNLTWADLRGADLSSVRGLLPQTDFIKANFERTTEGIIVYKSFCEHYPIPNYWKIEEGQIIEENCNFTRTNACGCGINVCTKEYAQKKLEKEVWKLLIKWEWLCGICVPYHTDGKIRCEKAMLLERVKG